MVAFVVSFAAGFTGIGKQGFAKEGMQGLTAGYGFGAMG